MPSPEEIRQLVRRAEQGDPSVLPALRTLLDGTPELWRQYGNLALHAECALVELAAGPNLMLAESLVRKLAALKADLAGAAASPLERLLAERVAACWLQTAYFDGVLAQSKGASPLKAGELRRQQDGAHRRLLGATKMLAIVRKLVQRAPSPLDLLRPVAEAGGSAARRAGPRLHGAGVEG